MKLPNEHEIQMYMIELASFNARTVHEKVDNYSLVGFIKQLHKIRITSIYAYMRALPKTFLGE